MNPPAAFPTAAWKEKKENKDRRGKRKTNLID